MTDLLGACQKRAGAGDAVRFRWDGSKQWLGLRDGKDESSAGLRSKAKKRNKEEKGGRRETKRSRLGGRCSSDSVARRWQS
jgi:hypothetical protein